MTKRNAERNVAGGGARQAFEPLFRFLGRVDRFVDRNSEFGHQRSIHSNWPSIQESKKAAPRPCHGAARSPAGGCTGARGSLPVAFAAHGRQRHR
jgi:hypothetical protein